MTQKSPLFSRVAFYPKNRRFSQIRVGVVFGVLRSGLAKMKWKRHRSQVTPNRSGAQPDLRTLPRFPANLLLPSPTFQSNRPCLPLSSSSPSLSSPPQQQQPSKCPSRSPRSRRTWRSARRSYTGDIPLRPSSCSPLVHPGCSPSSSRSVRRRLLRSAMQRPLRNRPRRTRWSVRRRLSKCSLWPLRHKCSSKRRQHRLLRPAAAHMRRAARTRCSLSGELELAPGWMEGKC